MKKIEIAVIDYGMGNLRSVSKAIEHIGAKVIVTENIKKILSAKALVFPGVGSFGPAIEYLKARGLDKAIQEAIASDKYFLGLCLGFQLLFDKSFENGKHDGLSVVSGKVRKFNFADKKYSDLKIPHMGWNVVEKVKSGESDRMFKNIPENSFFYFVHSYYGMPDDEKFVAGTTRYGIKFCSSLIREKVWACQFHPEKSGENGLKLLRNFVNEVGKC